MSEQSAETASLPSVMSELAALDDPKVRAVNARHGDDHGVKLSELRALAKRLKTRHELALQLWGTGDGAARLLAMLTCRPREFDRDELDAMVRAARMPKVHDWLVNYVVKKSPHAEELRTEWAGDGDPLVAAAAWDLTTRRVVGRPAGLDLAALLDAIDSGLRDAPEATRWAMNSCLAAIGIEHAEFRDRAVAIGERVGAFRDYPTSPGCTSPYAPTWIAEMVRRKGGA
ncbi:DNA alkylation repair protein [Tomitella fengzijianii]|uniref:DNA alkylation repair protein n=1 Tax=Tomitella fengzijianii TaxID=2597660 RepID=A0A516X4E3_9ACTN|nr:DNA alkylation repair protein [Tomitella fengzijianii]QDQ97945.1 DNA alkylation repair protein [Tomitella fengzijianii]